MEVVPVTGSLFSDLTNPAEGVEAITEGAVLLRGFASKSAPGLINSLNEILVTAPFRNMITPGGFRMSVAMTNCGDVGWVSDRTGYRYDPIDPLSGRLWPPMPAAFLNLAASAAEAAGFAGFVPDACLVNRYEPGTRLSLHQDRDERDFTAPIVSVSIGLPAVFLFGGLKRKDRPRRLHLSNGDIAVWGGPARLAYHGIASLADGEDALTGRCRINLTFRQAR
jgi:DNA oxidative demethylase